MKVKCIKKEEYNNDITIGNTYDVIRNGINSWLINDDVNEEYFVLKDNFIVLEETCCKINPKMLLSKEELAEHHIEYAKDNLKELDKEIKEKLTGTNNGKYIPEEDLSFSEFIQKHNEDDRVPDYYKGKNGYEARKVVDNFDLSYNVGTCVTYLLRCGKKTEEGMDIRDKHIEDIQKGINHLQFEIERLKE